MDRVRVLRSALMTDLSVECIAHFCPCRPWKLQHRSGSSARLNLHTGRDNWRFPQFATVIGLCHTRLLSARAPLYGSDPPKETPTTLVSVCNCHTLDLFMYSALP